MKFDVYKQKEMRERSDQSTPAKKYKLTSAHIASFSAIQSVDVTIYKNFVNWLYKTTHPHGPGNPNND